MQKCPGLYCGRVLLENNEWGECGSCPRGFRRNDSSYECISCLDVPTFYDWLYLGFMVIIALVLHWFFIDMVAKRRSFCKDVLILHFTALIEISLAATFTLLSANPVGSFQILSCKVRSLSDWYPVLHNPTPNYENTIHCTQEAVYPLYTLVFIFYSFALILMLLIRPWVCKTILKKKFLPKKSTMSIYKAMYFLPILAGLQAVAGGLIYYAFPYIIVVLSVISSAAHFSTKLDQSIFCLIINTVTDLRNIVIVLGHWCLHAYGIISITQLTLPMFHGLLIILVPLPAIFYILTSRFTDPSKLHID